MAISRVTILPGRPPWADHCACKHGSGHEIRSTYIILAKGLGWEPTGRFFPAQEGMPAFTYTCGGYLHTAQISDLTTLGKSLVYCTLKPKESCTKH